MDGLDDEENVKFQCERDWRRLRNIQAELQSYEAVPVVTAGLTDCVSEGVTSDTSRRQIYHEREKRLKAELQAIRENELKTLPDSDNLQLLIVEQDERKRLDCLLNTLVYLRAVRSEAFDDIKQTEAAYSQLSSLNSALKKKIAAVEQGAAGEDAGRTVESVLAEVTTKVEEVTKQNSHFKSTLKGILSKHFSLSDQTGGKNVLEQTRDVDVNNLLPLRSIIGRLIEQTLNSPEQPYIDIDDTFWPPYVEFLLRCQIVLKDPKNSHRMKLVPFHL